MHPRFRDRIDEVLAIRVREFDERRATAFAEIRSLIDACELLDAASPNDVYATGATCLRKMADALAALDPTDSRTPDMAKRISDAVCDIAAHVLTQYKVDSAA